MVGGLGWGVRAALVWDRAPRPSPLSFPPFPRGFGARWRAVGVEGLAVWWWGSWEEEGERLVTCEDNHDGCYSVLLYFKSQTSQHQDA